DQSEIYNLSLHDALPILGQISGGNLLFLKEGSHFLLAGKRWEIVEFKNKIQTIIVKKAYGKKPIKFQGGSQNIHRTIHQKMLEIDRKSTRLNSSHVSISY